MYFAARFHKYVSVYSSYIAITKPYKTVKKKNEEDIIIFTSYFGFIRTRG